MKNTYETKYFIFKNKELENFIKNEENKKEYKETIKIAKNENLYDITKNVKYYFLIIKLIILNYKNYLNINDKIKKNNIPYIIGITGSVASGKTTLAKIIKIILKYHVKKKITNISTDNFLYPNNKLIKKKILNKKGFPESYDLKNLIKFLIKVKSGKNEIKIPKYSHSSYDILKRKQIIINKPNIIILEGLNILQTNTYKKNKILSDFINFSIYINVKEKLLEKWYVNRLSNLYNNRNKIKNCFLQKFNNLTKKELLSKSIFIWNSINKPNLIENILPTKRKATLILNKTYNHKINKIKYKI